MADGLTKPSPMEMGEGPKERGRSGSLSDGHRKQTILEQYGFSVGQTLGYGSYATVKAAYSNKHQCKVAVKMVSKKKAPEDYLTKFLPREIEVVKILKHPNLICFLQSIETTNRVYLIMEMADKGDLLGVIQKEGHIKEKQAGIWFGHLTEGIEYIHSKGVVHRDLKCENILLDNKNRLKVTDFGFARDGIYTPEGKIVMSETYCGSYAYAPPEILTGTPYDSTCADVWSMGVILFTMVFGRLPFDDSNHATLLKQVHNPVTFPPGREWTTQECRLFITRILVGHNARYTIPAMKKDAWYTMWTAKKTDSARKRK